MKITLNELIKRYYSEVDYITSVKDKRGKQYIEVGNREYAKELINKYKNIKIVLARSQYAPELSSTYITLV